MSIDFLIVVAYFAVVLFLGLRGRSKEEVGVEEYFLNSRSLKWPSIAISTIATNISSGHFLSMAGSAYLFGLAQANFEINAVLGMLIAAFIIVPFYLKRRIITITQFFEEKFGAKVAVLFSVANIALFSLVYLGSTLFWGAYCVTLVFPEIAGYFGPNIVVQQCMVIVFLGVFSAFYTYLGGLGAVVRTDIVQFVLLVAGGLIVTFLALDKIGGPTEIYDNAKTAGMMHLHLPADHDKLPWTGLVAGAVLLNLNYWGANQMILQRSLAAKNLRHAQVGLMVGALFKYLMAFIIIVPAIALVGFTISDPETQSMLSKLGATFGPDGQMTLQEADKAYPLLVNILLPVGLKGLILCGLFASLMSTVDSCFNSVSTLWSIDIYKRLRPEATETEIVNSGKRAIIATCLAGILFSFIFVWYKASYEGAALTHWFNAITYYVKNGFVVLIVAAIFMASPSRKLVFWTMMATFIISPLFHIFLPEVNYLHRSGIVITVALLFVLLPTYIINGRFLPEGKLVRFAGRDTVWLAAIAATSLVLIHFLFH